LIAGFTDSNLSVEILALRFDFTANSIGIEIVMIWACNADAVVPCFASKIIIEDLDELWVF
jgi:hypothetical protein